jgi:tetratricopeptide (TPR) repeat protein
MTRRAVIASLAAAAAIAALALLATHRRAEPPLAYRPAPPPSAVSRILAATETNSKAAETAFRSYVAKHETSPNPEVQDQVGLARMHLGYLAAERGDLKGARKTFQTAQARYRGTGTINGDYGNLPDQAAYQAAVCLVASGERAAARAEFLRFLKERPLSPLDQAAYRRLVRMNAGKADAEGLKILEADLHRQNQQAILETSVCGPKALAYLLPRLGKRAPDYHDLAKLCGTTNQGTTLAGMRNALRALGVPSYAADLGRRDFENVKFPAVVLQGDHYLVATDIRAAGLHIYDPRTASETRHPTPAPRRPRLPCYGFRVLGFVGF